MLASHVHADAPDQRSAVFEPAVTDPAAFRTPLDVLAAEHTRQITICDMLDRWVRGPRRTDPAELKAVHDYLVLDLPLHIEDEDGDLFPLLKRRLPLGDDTEAIKGATDALMSASQSFAQRLCDQAGPDQAAGGGATGESVPDDDEVVDAEIVDKDEDQAA